MNKYRKQLTWIAGLLSFIGVACSDPNFEDYTSKLVVDGWIEQGKFAQVLLTKSTPYFGEIDSVILRKYSVTHAKVTLNNGTDEEILTLKPNHDFFPPYVYASTKIIGEVGKTYTLTIESEGQKITASTTIPKPVNLTDIWMEKNEDFDTLYSVVIQFNDEINVENYYQVFTRIGNEGRYTPTFSPNFEDKYFDGQEVKYSILKGGFNIDSKNEELYFRKDDTVSVRFCTVDRDSYLFWITFNKELANTANPFAATNSQVKTNIENGLGVWCGYGAVYYSVFNK